MKYPRCCVCRTIISKEPHVIAKQNYCPRCAMAIRKYWEMARRYRLNPRDQEARKYLGLPTNERKELRIDA